MNYWRDTTQGGGGPSDVPLQPGPPGSECVALPVLFFIPHITERSNSAAPFDPVAVLVLLSLWDVSTDPSLSPPNVALNSHRGCLCRGVYEPRTVEMTFAPRLAATARAAIWQSHQEHFTCLTFTCLHAVNITSLPLRMSPEQTDFQREKRGRGERERRRWKERS